MRLINIQIDFYLVLWLSMIVSIMNPVCARLSVSEVIQETWEQAEDLRIEGDEDRKKKKKRVRGVYPKPSVVEETFGGEIPDRSEVNNVVIEETSGTNTAEEKSQTSMNKHNIEDRTQSRAHAPQPDVEGKWNDDDWYYGDDWYWQTEPPEEETSISLSSSGDFPQTESPDSVVSLLEPIHVSARTFQESTLNSVPGDFSFGSTSPGTLYLYAGRTRNEQYPTTEDVYEVEFGDTVLNVFSDVFGYCTRSEAAFFATDTSRGYCRFTYTLYDSSDGFELGSFIAKGEVRGPGIETTLVVSGGTQEFLFANGVVHIIPVVLDFAFDPPDIEVASGDVFIDSQGFLHFIELTIGNYIILE